MRVDKKNTSYEVFLGVFDLFFVTCHPVRRTLYELPRQQPHKHPATNRGAVWTKKENLGYRGGSSS